MNRINGTRTFDTIFGSDLDDLIYGRAEDDALFGGTGDDTLYGGRGNDALHAQFGNNNLYGNLDNDALYAGTGSDNLFGGQGDDTLAAEQSTTSFLRGGKGDDLLVLSFGRATGGPGDDTFYLGDWFNFGRTYSAESGAIGDVQGDRGADRFDINFITNGLTAHTVIRDFNPIEGDTLNFSLFSTEGFPAATHEQILDAFDSDDNRVLNDADLAIEQRSDGLYLFFWEDITVLNNVTDLSF